MGCSSCCGGPLGLGAHLLPLARPLVRQSGCAAFVLRAREAQLWEPDTQPTAHALASWRCTL